jgi:hypothetical protein
MTVKELESSNYRSTAQNWEHCGKVNWINKKLIHFHWLWDRVLDGYIIFDITSEQIHLKEYVYDKRTVLK